MTFVSFGKLLQTLQMSFDIFRKRKNAFLSYYHFILRLHPNQIPNVDRKRLWRAINLLGSNFRSI